jgi:hypothetical protein
MATKLHVFRKAVLTAKTERTEVKAERTEVKALAAEAKALAAKARVAEALVDPRSRAGGGYRLPALQPGPHMKRKRRMHHAQP